MTTERKARELLSDAYGVDIAYFGNDPVPLDIAIRAITRALESAGQGEAFVNLGDSESQFIAHHADACPHCGGSGHAGDIATRPEAQAGWEVDVTGFGTPPLMHEERPGAEKAYSLTAFDYAAAPIGSRDWSLYWRGWWHRSLVDTTPPAKVPDGYKLVPVEPTPEMLNAATDATGAGSDMDWTNRSPQRLFAQGYAALLAAAPAPKEGA